MGYETRLIIGSLTTMKGHENKDCDYVIPIAEIDLCKSCFYDTYLDQEKDTHKVYFYEGDNEIITDKYGKQLFAIPPAKVLKKMQQENKKEYYRRYAAAIPMLKSLMKDFKSENLTCILYGH
jgi:hypothetical protein